MLSCKDITETLFTSGIEKNTKQPSDYNKAVNIIFPKVKNQPNFEEWRINNIIRNYIFNEGNYNKNLDNA